MTRTLTFSADFTFGAATAAFQIEGAHTEDGRGPSIWDAMCEEPGRILDGSDGSRACDHYHQMERDVALMKSLNLQTYRFSTSWARIFPDGKSFNPAGADFYSRLVDELLDADITPWLTLYHWDLPQALGERGGWTNRDTAMRFADYADTMYRAIGDRVKTWTTLNEPWCSSFLSYACGEHAPGVQDPTAAVDAAHHLLLAHGLGVQALRAAGAEKVGVTLNHTVAHPADPNSAEDVDAARRIDGAFNRIFLDPIFKGHYPSDVIEDMSDAGLGRVVQEGDLKVISEPIDVLGVNFYNGGAFTVGEPQRPISPTGKPLSTPFVGSDHVIGVDRGLERTHMGWEVHADDLRLLLLRLEHDYTGPAGIPIVITENGAAYDDQPDAHDFVDDSNTRQVYIRDHLAAVHAAMEEGANVTGYLVWSLLDNFEWAFGYTRRFGIVRVNYDTMARTPKASAWWYAEVAKTHRMDV